MKLAGINLKRHIFWRLATSLILLALILPLVLVVSRSFSIDTNRILHIVENLLPAYFLNTGGLLLGVAALSLVLGVSTAWYVTIYDFPFRRHFEWVLILPLSIPTFINAIS